MANFPSVLIDPYILYLDMHIDDFVEKVVAWSGLTSRGDVELLFSEDCMLSMYDENCFPLDHHIRDYYRQNACDYIDENTLCNIVKTIIEKTPYFEEVSGHKYAIFDEKNVDILPDILSRLKTKVGKSFLNCLHIFSVWVTSSNKNSVIGSRTSGISQSFDGYLSIKSSVEEIEPYSDRHKFSYQYPIPIDCHHPLYNCFDQIIENIDVLEIWDEARNEKAVKDCIDKRTSALIKSGLPDRRLEYSLGKHLVDSLKNWSFDSRADWARTFIDSCARIILQMPKNSVDPFWEDSHKRKQRMRSEDGAKACRTHLTKSNEGFRLMLWILPDNSIEFANVGDKNELEIY